MQPGPERTYSACTLPTRAERRAHQPATQVFAFLLFRQVPGACNFLWDRNWEFGTWQLVALTQTLTTHKGQLHLRSSSFLPYSNDFIHSSPSALSSDGTKFDSPPTSASLHNGHLISVPRSSLLAPRILVLVYLVFGTASLCSTVSQLRLRLLAKFVGIFYACLASDVASVPWSFCLSLPSDRVTGPLEARAEARTAHTHISNPI